MPLLISPPQRQDRNILVHLCRLGWVPAIVVLSALTLSTIYSGHLLLRLYNAVPNAVLFGDIGEAAAGSRVSHAFIASLQCQQPQV